MESVNKFISLIVLVIGLVVIWRRPENDAEVLRLETVISSLLKYEQNHVDRTSPKITVGYGACKDLFVTRMMDGVGFPQTVDNYLGVRSQEEMISMLGYFFQAGAAAERFVHDEAHWSRLLESGQSDPVVGGLQMMDNLPFMEGQRTEDSSKRPEGHL